MAVEAWRVPTKEEMRAHLDSIRVKIDRTKHAKSQQLPSILAVRQHQIPVDVYCYLKTRFGEPNGFQNWLREDSSDNLVHWDFMLKAGTQDVYISGTNRQIHFVLSERLTDEDWRNLILKIKTDFKRVGKAKSAVMDSLKKWVIFPNKFVPVANLCADLHSEILDNIGGFQTYKPSRNRLQVKTLDRLTHRSTKLYRACLELSLITPVMAEAFINMVILILCKRQIKDNPRQFEAFIRSAIDTKVFDLSYKCERFVKPIDQTTMTYKNFKRVMDKRNHAIHGNIDPEKEQIEMVYFEGKIPLFKRSGDHIGQFLEASEKRHQPETVIKDYENTYEFLLEIVACLDPGAVTAFWEIMEHAYPGYELGRKITGRLFPDYVTASYLQGLRYDDELAVNW